MGVSVALPSGRGAVKSQVPTEGAWAWQVGGLGPGGHQLSTFSSFQVSHEFAINFNPTNPFCSGERQASLPLCWVCTRPSPWAEGGQSTGFCTFLLSPPPHAFSK